MIDNFHTFEFNGHKLSELGAVIAQRPILNVAIRDINLAEIPLHSGSLIVDNKRYKNISYKYKIRAVPSYCNLSLADFTAKISEWLSTGNYEIYRDTYITGYYRYAVVTNIMEIQAIHKDVYETEITFSFQPFLYSDTGANVISLSSTNNSVSTMIINPEQWDSEPIIKINGSGNFSVSVGSVSFNLTGVNNYIIIDKPNEDVYDSGGSCNDKLSGLYLPTLKAGENNITITGNNSFSVDITPNWRRL